MVRPDKNTDSRIPHGCEQVPVGLTDVGKLTGIVKQSNAVIYCAGSVRGRNPEAFATANIKGVQAILGALEQSDNPPPLLLLSSLAASRPLLSDYAHSKHEGEQLLHQKPLLPWTILRPSAVYGPGDKEMLPVLKMARKGLLAHAGPSNQRLSLLHVDDLTNAVTTWLSNPHQHLLKTYAIDDGTPGGYGWEDIGEAVSVKKPWVLEVPRFLLQLTARINLLLSSLLGYAPMLTPGKVREIIQADWLCDNSAFTAASGWKPQVNLKQGTEQLFMADSAKPFN